MERVAHDIDWLERDQDFTEGIDHLGIQVVSTNIYARLLPGISNLTDRARYFSFYPWVLDTYARNCSTKSHDAWKTWIRRHEFTFSAASISAETAKKVPDEAAGGIIGARAARRILNKNATQSLDIDVYTRVENGKAAKNAYFQNREGGYGQYYKNQMTVLGIMDRDTDHKYPDRLLTTCAGRKLGALIDQSQAFQNLSAIVTAGTVTLTDLVALGEKIHPGLIDPDGDEAEHLRGLVLGDSDDLCKGQKANERLQRRRTLALCLHYLQAGDTEWGDHVRGFRWGVLEAHHGDGSAWTIPAELETTRLAWALYVQNELMNYALECLLWSLMTLIEEDQKATPQEHAAKLAAAATDPTDSSRPIPPTIDAALASAVPPTNPDPWNPLSTWALVTELDETKEALGCAAAAFRILLRVGADRARFNNKAPFDYLDDGADIAKRDIHLQSWWNRLDAASRQPSEVFLARLVLDWVVFRHLRVATRKLASQGDYTYRFRPEEGQLVACGVVAPGFTNPRLRQGMQMLADLGLIAHGFGAVTQHGVDFLAAVP